MVLHYATVDNYYLKVLTVHVASTHRTAWYSLQSMQTKGIPSKHTAWSGTIQFTVVVCPIILFTQDLLNRLPTSFRIKPVYSPQCECCITGFPPV